MTHLNFSHSSWNLSDPFPKNARNNSNKISNIAGNSEQLIVTSIKHEDGSPPTNIIKKESTNPAAGSSSGSTSNTNANNSNSNDSNNNNDTNDNKNSSANASMQDDKDSIGGNNDNSITDDLLNNEDLGLSGSAGGNKMGPGMHIKSEDTSGDMNSDNFGPMSQGPGGPNSCRMMSQSGSPERIQPLPSNVVNKQSNSMEVSFLQIFLELSYNFLQIFPRIFTKIFNKFFLKFSIKTFPFFFVFPKKFF